MDPKPVKYSVILPVFNEQDNLGTLLGELHRAMESLREPWEVLAVDDASTDRSRDVLKDLHGRLPALRVLCHRVNCGQSAAFASGLAHARGSVIITLDSDCQNDPADIPRMVSALQDGISAVLGVRRSREDSVMRRLSSRLANWYRDRLTGVELRDAGCFLRVIRREALAELPVFNGVHRFLGTILSYQGLRFVEVEIHHRPRFSGESKYGVRNRLWRGFRDCLAMRWYRDRVVPADRVLREETRDG